MKNPYIGITGFTTRDEVKEILSMVPRSSDRLAMIGVLASLKTLRGLQNRWPNRYPKVENISAIFTRHPRALNLIHYNTDEKETLYDQLVKLTGIAGRDLHGFQLNIAWPDPSALAKYSLKYPAKKIVLQIGGRAFELIEYLPAKLAKKVAEEYAGLLDYILLDPSGGYGKLLDVRSARAYLCALRMKNLDIGLGVAGGLSPETLDIINPLARDFPDVSIDAEGRLRDAEDRLDLVAASDYFMKAMLIFSDVRESSSDFKS